MSNLIVTIISIALAGVLAIMAVWYGGDIWNKSSAKANATTIAQQARQIVQAWQVYANDKGGGYFLPNMGSGGGTQLLQLNNPDLVPAYLSAWPIAPAAVTSPNGAFKGGYYNWMIVAYPAGGGAIQSGNALALSLFDAETCIQTGKIFNGDNALPTPRTTPGNTFVLPAGRYADCFFIDANTNGVFDLGIDSGTWFVWKVY